MKHQELSDRIICCFYNVYNGLGYGFLEKVYENALALEFSCCSVDAVQQSEINVSYRHKTVGKYYADIVVGERIIVEIKRSKPSCLSMKRSYSIILKQPILK